MLTIIILPLYRLSNDYVDHLYHLVMTQLNQDHAEVRFSAFQMATELFNRSHHFRTLLVTNLQEFLELTVETDVEQPLPPPKEVARKLKTQAIQTVQVWQTTYGEAYKKLALGYHFLKQVKKVNYSLYLNINDLFIIPYEVLLPLFITPSFSVGRLSGCWSKNTGRTKETGGETATTGEDL